MKIKLAASIGIAILVTWTMLSANNETSSASSREEAVRVLNAYAATQEKLQRISYKSKHVSLTDYDLLHGGRHLKATQKKEEFDVSLWWDDGKRARMEKSHWEYVGGEKKYKQYSSVLFDGHSVTRYSNNLTSPIGAGQISTDKNGFNPPMPDFRVLINGSAQEFFGYLKDDWERVDRILLMSKNLSARKDINGCYVVKGKSKHGEYTIQLDPAKDHQIIKAEYKKRSGDILLFGNPIRKDGVIDFKYTIDKLERVQDVWIPVETHMSFYKALEKGQYQKGSEKTTRSEIKLNPNFDNPPVFVPDDVKDGASFFRYPDKYRGKKIIEYTWQKGNLVPTGKEYYQQTN